MMKLTTRLLLSLSASASLLMASSLASATPGFPGAVASHLGLSSTPACSLCHVGPTARGTVNTPFGKSMMSRGLQAYDEASLKTALDALTAEKKDSDGDTQGDIDELKAGASPNEGAAGAGGGAAAPSTVTPEYGCSATPASTPPSLIAWLGAVGVTFVLRRRSRRATMRSATTPR
jgi:MYXO-CTERM domain-containing protein